MFLVQLSNKVNAKVDAMGFEVDKIQSAAIVRGVQLSRKIDQFRQRAANLQSNIITIISPIVQKLLRMRSPFRRRLRG